MKKILLIPLLTLLFSRTDSTNVIPKDEYKFTVETSMGAKLKIVDYNIFKDEIHVTGNYEIWKSLPKLQIKYITDINNNIVWKNKVFNEKINKDKISNTYSGIFKNNLLNKMQLSIGIGKWFNYKYFGTTTKNIAPFNIGTNIKFHKNIAATFNYGFWLVDIKSFSAGFSFQSNYNDTGFFLNSFLCSITAGEYNVGVSNSLITTGIQYKINQSKTSNLFLNFGLIYLNSQSKLFVSIENNFGRSK